VKNKRTIQRWLKDDPGFVAQARSALQITVGPLPEPNYRSAASDPLDALPPSRAWASITKRTLLGSALHPSANPTVTDNRDHETGRTCPFTADIAASVIQVELVSSNKRAGEVHAALSAGMPPSQHPDELAVPLTLAGLYHLQHNPDDLDLFIRAATDFRVFLNLWQFTNQEAGSNAVLGEVLWPAQEEFVRMAVEHPWVFFLKARKLGETTIACAYDAWVIRFRDQNARVHLFSRREDAARDLLVHVKYGLERLPSWLQLPVTRTTADVYELGAGRDDHRLAKAYPADKETAVENSCTHGHVDEWARMGNPRKVWQAIEPTMAGSCHIVTTGLGPTNYTSEYWRRCIAGDTTHHPCFIGALNRPDRTAAWLKGKQRGMDEQQFRQEYPTTWQDALSGGGDFVFRTSDIDACGTDFLGLQPASEERPAWNSAQQRALPKKTKYVTAWDIGRHQDAAVGLVLDITEDVHDVVAYRRLRGVRYPEIQHEIEKLHRAYPGITVIEDNAAGEAVRENLDLPQHELLGFRTTASSKARIIEQLQIAVQNWVIKWDPAACPQLDAEMRGYQRPDDNVVQDSVIALAIALEHAPLAHKGRVLDIMYF
jgi:Terminase RNaseH-like domain